MDRAAGRPDNLRAIRPLRHGLNPLFPGCLKIGMSIGLALGAVWYAFMYRKLKRIDIAALMHLATIQQAVPRA